MEIWVIYAIVSIFFAGLFNFGFKVISKRGYNTSYVSMLSYSMGAVLATLYYFSIDLQPISSDDFMMISLLAFGNTLFFFFSILARVRG